jgi:hypothetical protein
MSNTYITSETRERQVPRGLLIMLARALSSGDLRSEVYSLCL